MNFTTIHIPAQDHPPIKRRIRALGRLLLYVGATALLACVMAAPAVAPWHGRLRAVFVTLIPLSAGYAVGALDHDFARRKVPVLIAAAALILVAAVLPGLRADVPPLMLGLGLLGGVAVALALTRIGMLQAGIGWRNHEGNQEEDYAPGWAGALALGLAWGWLFLALLNPRENFPPTRWLLTITGAPPTAQALHDSRISLERLVLTTLRISPERGLVESGGYQFRVGPLTPGPGTLEAAVSVRRVDGAPFGQPVWLTLDVDDPAHPDGQNDAQYYSVSELPAHSPEAESVLSATGSNHLTAYAWYGVTQSLPAVHLRARLWVLDGRDDGSLRFRLAADAELGTWNLSLLRKLKPRG